MNDFVMKNIAQSVNDAHGASTYRVRSPVLVIVFNRPHETRAVFDALRAVQPKRLYVAADAPRQNKHGESAKCMETLGIFKDVDWPCEVFFKVNDHNLGSHTTIPQAIDWFFDREEEGIVLEDDCIPSTSFFRYCDELLERYRNDPRIMWINGSNVGFKGNDTELTYCFSIYAISWGWASWRRAWALFNGHYRTTVGRAELNDILRRNVGYSILAELYWRCIFNYAYTIKNWDFRWLNAFWGNGGLACTPTVNMISNIGFGVAGMHRARRNDPRGHIQAEEVFGDIKGPKKMAPYGILDDFLNRRLYKIGPFSISKVFLASRAPWLRNAVRRIQGDPV